MAIAAWPQPPASPLSLQRQALTLGQKDPPAHQQRAALAHSEGSDDKRTILASISSAQRRSKAYSPTDHGRNRHPRYPWQTLRPRKIHSTLHLKRCTAGRIDCGAGDPDAGTLGGALMYRYLHAQMHLSMLHYFMNMCRCSWVHPYKR